MTGRPLSPTPEPLLLIVAGRTAPNRAVVFGGEHGELDARGRRDVEQLKNQLDLPGRCAARIGPEASVRHTARLLGLSGRVDPRLATLDLGSWRGRAPEQIAADELRPWFTDPATAPHGGETVAAFVARIRAYVAGLPADSVLVLAKPVVQGLLCAEASGFFATDIRPASVHRC